MHSAPRFFTRKPAYHGVQLVKVWNVIGWGGFLKVSLRLRIACDTDACSVYRMLMIGVETPMQNGCKFESLSEKHTMGKTALNWWNIASLSLV